MSSLRSIKFKILESAFTLKTGSRQSGNKQRLNKLKLN